MRMLYSFRSKLIFAFSACAVFIIFIATLVFFSYCARLLQRSSGEAMVQAAETLAARLDVITTSMDSTALQIISSREVQSALKESLQYSGEYNYFDIHDSSGILNALISINSPLLLHARLSVFDINQNFVTVGYLGVNSSAFQQTFQQYQERLLPKDDAWQKYILPTRMDNWVRQDSAVPVISLVRKIPDILSVNRLLGYVEVQQPYSMIEEICQGALQDTAYQVMIVNDAGGLIYPYGDSSVTTADLMQHAEAWTTFPSQQDWNGAKMYVLRTRCSSSDWNILLAQPKTAYEYPVRLLILYIAILFLVFSFVTVLLITKLSSFLTRPIARLRSAVEKLTPEDAYLQFKAGSQNSEINMLTAAFNDTINRLNDAMKQAMAAHQSQTTAQLLAMQSQMNPHFLFNTLMGISGIAEENHDQKVVEICDMLASMLRYISSYKDTTATWSEEIHYAQLYLELMKIRHEDFLTYTIDCSLRQSNLVVPKLILQPIVENCFSHGFHNIAPPYQVDVLIQQTEDAIVFSVRDNGEGFSEDWIQQFRAKTQTLQHDFDAEKYLKESQLGGLGLSNVSLRLRLMFGPGSYLEVENLSPRGACVRGIIPLRKEQSPHV